METSRLTLFWGLTKKKENGYLTLEEVHRLITNDKTLLDITQRHRADRSIGLKKEADRWKKRMAVVTVATHCKGGRTKRHVESYTGYSLADFDHLTAAQLEHCLTLLEADPYWLLAHTSIGGEGLHVVFRIPLVTDEGAYKKAFEQGNRHYAQLFGADYDTKNEDPTRALGLCHDEHCLYRPEAEEFPVDFTLAEDPKAGKGKTPKKKQSKPATARLIKSALQWANRNGIRYEEGNRNDFLMRILYKLNRLGASESDVRKWAVRKYGDDYGVSETEAVVRSCFENREEHGTEMRSPRPYATPTQVAEFLCTKALFRKNIVTRYTEMQTLGQTEWKQVSDYEVHSLWLQMDGQAELPRPRGAKEFFQILDSSFVPLYNPFEDYFRGLPEWHEGDTDYIGQLAATVHTTDDAHFCHCLRKWLVAMVAALFTPTVVNQTILVFIGEQGIYKTKWFNSLLPPELRLYFCTHSHSERYSKDDRLMLAEFALVCFEEIDSPGRTALAQLKAMVTMEKVNERAAYARNKEERQHIASFCATGNNKQFLVDPTGNRRWLAFEVLEIADPYSHAIDYKHLYAQIYALWKKGFQYYFTQEEIRRLNERNEEFMNVSPEEEMLLTHFCRPTHQLPGRYLTSTQIISHCNPWVKQPLRQRVMVEALKKHGYQMQRRGSLRCYYIVPLDSAQVAQNAKEGAATAELGL